MRQADAIRERLAAVIDTLDGLYHRAEREFDLPTVPSAYNAKGWPELGMPNARWSSPFELREVADYMRDRIDYIITGRHPPTREV